MPRKEMKKNKRKETYVSIAIIGFMVAIIFVLGYGLYSKGEGGSPPQSIALSIAQEKIYSRALSEYLCPCGECNEVLADCVCTTALRIKKDARQRLQREEAGYKDIVWLLENTYKAKKRT